MTSPTLLWLLLGGPGVMFARKAMARGRGFIQKILFGGGGGGAHAQSMKIKFLQMVRKWCTVKALFLAQIDISWRSCRYNIIM